MLSSISLFALISLALPLVSAEHHGLNARRHQQAAKRAEVNLQKRFSGARLTFYDAGLGACGKTNSASDNIVALNSAQYSGGAHCGQSITITVGGKSAQATIADECPGCPFGGLDLTTGLFKQLGSESDGVLTGSWTFGGGGGGGGDDDGDDDKKTSTSSSKKETPTPKPTTSSKTTTSSSKTSTSTSTSTHTTEHTTSSSSSSTHTTSSSSTSSTPTTTAINYSTGDASGLAIPTGVVGGGSGSNINDFNQAFVGLGAIIVAGSQSS